MSKRGWQQKEHILLTPFSFQQKVIVNKMSAPNAEENNNEMVVTPWEVKGKVDYERLIHEFGTQPLTPELLKRVEKHTDKLHLQLERKIFFSHRDLDTVLDLYDKGTKFVLYTGRGPSGPSAHRASCSMDIHPSYSTKIQNATLFPNDRRRKIPHQRRRKPQKNR